MTIKPIPKRTFIFTKEEFANMEMQRFRDEVAELRALPANDKNKLLGRYIIYPRVLTGTLSYTEILADVRMRDFMQKVNEIFPEWFFFFHAGNQFSPVHLYAQLDKLTIIEGPPAIRSRIVSSRADVLLVLLDAYAAARAVVDECKTRQQAFMTQVRRAFSVANFELSVMDDRLIPDQRKSRRIIVLCEADLEGKGLEKIRQLFAKADPKRDRAAFGFEILPDSEGQTPILYCDSITRFLRKVWIEVPESIYFLRANAPGVLSAVGSALQLQELRNDPENLQWHLMVSPDDVIQIVLKNYQTLRQLDTQSGVAPEETISHLESIFAAFGIRFCPTKKQ